MGKIGLINELTEGLNVKFLAFAQKESTREAEAFSDCCANTFGILRDIAETGDPEIILRAEKGLLDDELQHYSNFPEMANSLKTAHKEIDGAFRALESLQTPGAHRVLADSLSHKDIQNGLPLDGFRKFERSHQTRLANHLKGNLPLHEKALLRQRRENLQIARNAYIHFQQKVLEQF